MTTLLVSFAAVSCAVTPRYSAKETAAYPSTTFHSHSLANVFVSASAPTCAPTLVSAQALSSTSIRVTWTPLPNTQCRYGVLRGYKVAYKLHSSGNSLQYLKVNNPSSTTTDVTGVGKYTEYSFQVLAYTVKDGPLSNAKVITTKEDGKQLFDIKQLFS